MSRTVNRQRFRLRDISVDAAPDAGWVAVSQVAALPARFTATVDLESPACRVTLCALVGPDCDLLVKAVTVEVPDPATENLTSALLRGVLIHEITQETRAHVERPIAQLGGAVDWSVLNAKWSRPRQPRPATSEKVEECARLHREALASGLRATGSYIAAHLGVSTSQAHRHLRDARAAGLLDEDGDGR